MTSQAPATAVGVPTLESLRTQRKSILELAAAHGASNIRVYGSVARGEARVDSDVDLLVDFEQGRSLIDEVELKLELEALIGRTVDLAEDVHHSIREKVLADAVPL